MDKDTFVAYQMRLDRAVRESASLRPPRLWEKSFWQLKYKPITLDQIKPYDILCVREKAIDSALIVFFSGSEGTTAFLSHCGQILRDGRTVSEANFPKHEYTPIEKYLEEQKQDKVRLTVVRLIDDLWYDQEFREKAEQFCETYHRSLRGAVYPVPDLFKMMGVSILRSWIPFLKHGKWEDIVDAEQLRQMRVCSGIIDNGWGLVEQTIQRDLFPCSLSLDTPSPQDIFDAWSTRFVCGYYREKKVVRRKYWKRSKIYE